MSPTPLARAFLEEKGVKYSRLRIIYRNKIFIEFTNRLRISEKFCKFRISGEEGLPSESFLGLV